MPLAGSEAAIASRAWPAPTIGGEHSFLHAAAGFYLMGAGGDAQSMPAKRLQPCYAARTSHCWPFY